MQKVLFLVSLLFSLSAQLACAVQIKIIQISPPSIETVFSTKPNQIPLSRVAYGLNNIKAAWLAGATTVYRHGVLGDAIEASQLMVEMSGGRILQFDLPDNRVFEDVEPRLADMTGDDVDEVIVVESDVKLGASLAVFGIVGGHLVRVASTPFIGRAYRWLNPVGVGDFDGDGDADAALISTPHIGGVLRLYRLQGQQLEQFANYSGVSTHSIGSTQVSLGRVIFSQPRDRLLVPNQEKNILMLLEWSPKGWKKHAEVRLPSNLVSSLKPMKSGVWSFKLASGEWYKVVLEK